MSAVSTDELSSFLNMLLEAERAGAKVLAVFLEEYPRESKAWQQLRRVQQDEAHNCAVLIDAIQALGAAPSRLTGQFLHKALAVQGRSARLKFLNRGQDWVARQVAVMLPRLPDTPVREMLSRMHVSHMANIKVCDQLLSIIDDRDAE